MKKVGYVGILTMAVVLTFAGCDSKKDSVPMVGIIETKDVTNSVAFNSEEEAPLPTNTVEIVDESGTVLVDASTEGEVEVTVSQTVETEIVTEDTVSEDANSGEDVTSGEDTVSEDATGSEDANSGEDVTSSEEDQSMVEIPNPFITYKKMSTVKRTLGYKLSYPDEIEGYTMDTLQATSDGLIQVIFIDEQDNRCFIRKAPYDENMILSGDYNDYKVTKDFDIEDGITVTMKGDAKDQYKVAEWHDKYGDFGYAIMSDVPMSYDVYEAIILNTK